MTSPWPFPLPELNLVGPEGYTHGWVKHGSVSMADLKAGDHVQLHDGGVYKAGNDKKIVGSVTRTIGKHVSVSATHSVHQVSMTHVKSGKSVKVGAAASELLTKVAPRTGALRLKSAVQVSDGKLLPSMIAVGSTPRMRDGIMSTMK
jgi:hypothetical protein